MSQKHNITYTKNEKSIWFVLSVLISLFILSIRYPDTLSTPQLWAEDGPVFFKEAFELGLGSIFNPYAGYLHFIPRFIALIGQWLISYEFIPLFYNLASLVFVLILISYIWIRTSYAPFLKFLFSVSIVLIPIGNEVFLTITNIQWIMALAILILFASTITSKYVWLDSILILLCGLTGPFCLVFLPAVLVLSFLKRKEYLTVKNSWVAPTIYLVSCIVQFMYVLTSSRVSENGVRLIDKIISFPHAIYLQFISLTGIERFYNPKTDFLLLSFILLILMLWVIYSIYKKKYIVLFFLCCAFLLMMSYTIGLNSTVYVLHPVLAGSRYFYIPFVCVIWALLDFASINNYRIYLLVILLSYYAYLSLCIIPSKKYVDKNWKEYVNRFEVQKDSVIVIPINPEGWSVTLKK